MANGVRYFFDTNIWLERMLDQDKSNEVAELLSVVPTNRIFISDFSLHSIAVILFKLKNVTLLQNFLIDLFKNGRVRLLRLSPLDHLEVIRVHQQNKLDFDDAYQFHVAAKYRLVLVTYDSDFKGTQRVQVVGPKEVIKKYL